jgi:hypothetical protein
MDLQLSFIISVPLPDCSMLPHCLPGLPGSMAFMQMSADELERYHKNHPKVMQVRPLSPSQSAAAALFRKPYFAMRLLP